MQRWAVTFHYMLDLGTLVDTLRAEGGDLPSVEVKSAAGGLPDSLVPTLCALANRPGGGTVILGLDESAGFAPVGLPDRRKMKAALASKARQAFDPPVTVELDEGQVDGLSVIVAVVLGLNSTQKPCRVRGGQYAGVWLRAWDGDYRASDLEVQGLLAARGNPTFDAQPVVGASRADLDRDLVAGFVDACRSGSEQLASMRDNEELLWRMGVVAQPGGVPTVAGLLALGEYPQQYLPSTGLQAVALTEDGHALRAGDTRRFDGPIPHLLRDATAWVARVAPTAIQQTTTGDVRDVPHWPSAVVRELVANSLIHRDLSPWALGETSLLRVDSERLVVRNPGGLYGLTVERLGQIGVTSARNANLVRICQYVRLADGRRAVEALATGIPTVLSELAAADLPNPIFDDDGLRFTVIVRRRSSRGQIALSASATKVFGVLVRGRLTVTQISEATGLAPATVRKWLRDLRERGFIVQHGGRGLPTTYERAGDD